ncbi:MAG: hypothetical protein IKC59_04615 [Clostridia bacterium]|nr:hypothetical protein [Clostridia bacterium]
MKKNYQNPTISLFAVSENDILTASETLGALSNQIHREVGTNASYGDDIVSWGKYVK